jgi:hypothetical protein
MLWGEYSLVASAAQMKSIMAKSTVDLRCLKPGRHLLFFVLSSGYHFHVQLPALPG